MSATLRAAMKPVLAVMIVGVAVAAAAYLVGTRPQAKRAAPRLRVPAVEVTAAVPEERRIEIAAMGTVVPARRVTVRPEVSGRIVFLNPSLTAGGLISAGEELLRLDPREYQIAVEQQEAMVTQAQSELQLEEGRRLVAEQEWKLFESEITATEGGRDLALRKPQVRRARAALEAALSGLDRARLNLERTSISTPFNAVVIEESAEVGQLVTPQSPLATLVGTGRFWAQVSVPVERINAVVFPGKDGSGGSAVSIRDASAASESMPREGKVIRLLGELDPAGRMARILISIEDPMGLNGGAGMPVLLGAYVSVVVEGRELKNVFRVPRRALREGDTLYILDRDDRLKVVPAEILWSGEREVYLGDGLEAGDRIILSRIATPVPGMALRIAGDARSTGDTSAKRK